jgi:hypothetical protein
MCYKWAALICSCRLCKAIPFRFHFRRIALLGLIARVAIPSIVKGEKVMAAATRSSEAVCSTFMHALNQIFMAHIYSLFFSSALLDESICRGKENVTDKIERS